MRFAFIRSLFQPCLQAEGDSGNWSPVWFLVLMSIFLCECKVYLMSPFNKTYLKCEWMFISRMHSSLLVFYCIVDCRSCRTLAAQPSFWWRKEKIVLLCPSHFTSPQEHRRISPIVSGAEFGWWVLVLYLLQSSLVLKISLETTFSLSLSRLGIQSNSIELEICLGLEQHGLDSYV